MDEPPLYDWTCTWRGGENLEQTKADSAENDNVSEASECHVEGFP